MFVYSFRPLSDLSIFVQPYPHPLPHLFLLRSRPAVRVRVLQAVANGSVLYHRPDRRYTLGTYNRTVLWACSHVKPQPNDLRGLMVAPAVGPPPPPSNRSSDKLPLMKPLHLSTIIRAVHARDNALDIGRLCNLVPVGYANLDCLFFLSSWRFHRRFAPRQRSKPWPERVPFPVVRAHSSAVSIVDHQGGRGGGGGSG